MSSHIQSASAENVLAPSGPAIDDVLLGGRKTFLGYLRRRLGSLDEAEDVLQNFCVKVIRAAKTPRDDENVKVWMGQILRHTLIDHYRRRAVRQRVEADFARELAIAEVSDDRAPEAASCRCLHAALMRLRPDYAELLRRADLGEEPRARIAADLGLTMNTLNVRLHRARKALRDELMATCPDCREGRFLECHCK